MIIHYFYIFNSIKYELKKYKNLFNKLNINKST